MNRKMLLIAMAVIVVLIAVAAFQFYGRTHSLQGAVLTPPWPAPDITLTDQHGRPFHLSGQRGKAVLLYFGYTNCPNECPLTMAHVKLALESLGARAAQVQVVMVSTDPARDTPDALKKFMGSFNPAFLGLTGTPGELAGVWKDYGVVVENGGEAHTTYLYVLDPAGNVRETFQPDTQPDVIAGDLGLLLKGK